MKVDHTKGNKYTPTNAEQKLLDVLMDPNNRLLNVTDICNLAEISRKTYCESFKKEEFIELHHTTSLEMVKQHSIELIKIGLNYAREGSSQHWRILMEMANLYKTRKETEQDQNTETELRVVFVSPDDD